MDPNLHCPTQLDKMQLQAVTDRYKQGRRANIYYALQTKDSSYEVVQKAFKARDDHLTSHQVLLSKILKEKFGYQAWIGAKHYETGPYPKLKVSLLNAQEETLTREARAMRCVEHVMCLFVDDNDHLQTQAQVTQKRVLLEATILCELCKCGICQEALHTLVLGGRTGKIELLDVLK